MNSALEQQQLVPWNRRIWQQLVNPDQQPPQAVLLLGRRGLGKRQLAVQYAANLLNSNEPFWNANHPDCHVLKAEADLHEGELLSTYALRYITPTKTKPKRIISIEQIRQLIEQATQHPHLAPHKIMIIDGAEKMTTSAANALLKNLEEPVSNTTFLLIAENNDQMPVTIRSRCAVFKFRAPDVDTGLDWVQRQTDASDASAYLAMAGGAPLLALELLEQEAIQQLREIFTQINLLLAGKTTAMDAAKQWQNYAATDVVDILQKLLIDVSKLQQLKAQSATAHNEQLFFPVQRDWIAKVAQHAQTGSLFALQNTLNECKRLLNTPVDATLLLENLALNFAKLTSRSL